MYRHLKISILLLLSLLLAGCQNTTFPNIGNIPTQNILDDSQTSEATYEPSPTLTSEAEEIDDEQIEIEGKQVIDSLVTEQWTYYVTYHYRDSLGKMESIYQSNADRSEVRLLAEIRGNIRYLHVKGTYLYYDHYNEGAYHNSRVSIDNPYIGTGETRESWRYDLFEVFRGAEEISFDNMLEFSKEYENMIPDYESKHEFTYSVTFPQTSIHTSWAEQVNGYYQELMPKYIKKSDATFEDVKDDWHSARWSLNFDSAYIVGNILNIICYQSSYGRRFYPSSPEVDIFSAIDGRLLSLNDLFNVKEEVYRPILEESLAKAKNRFGVYYAPKYDEYEPNYAGAAEIFDMASVAVTPIGLVFIYSTGTARIMAAGPVFLDAPYEDLKEILNPDYFPDFFS